GIPYPLEINKIPIETLEAIPGIGRKRALRIVRARPISGEKDLFKILDDENMARRLIDLGISF
ncbi:radical SAM protein, partial [bacterium]|nr:radical SAM protein [bacterium]